MNDVFFWLSYRDLTNNTVWRFARDAAGRNGTAQTIASITTAPTSVTWRELSEIPFEPMISTFDANDTYPLWIWRHITATAFSDEEFSQKDDPCIFNYAFKIGVAGTPSPGEGPGTDPGGGGGGGSGGNPPPSTADFKIAFVGDEGCENATEDVIQLITDNGFDVLVSGGDHAYESASCWTNLFNPLKTSLGSTNFFSAYGNHEYEESGGINPYKTFFGDTLTYFKIKVENIGFVVMDTNIDIDQSSTQGGKVTQWLAEHNADSSVEWKIVVMHHPWWVDGSRNEANEFNQIQEWHSAFTTAGVDLVICAHNHNWQRTHQLTYNSGDPLHSPNIAASTSPYTQGARLIHVVTGGGGHDSGTGLYQLPSQPSFQAYQSRLYNGVWVIESSNSGQTLSCYFLNTDNTKFDEFVLNR